VIIDSDDLKGLVQYCPGGHRKTKNSRSRMIAKSTPFIPPKHSMEPTHGRWKIILLLDMGVSENSTPTAILIENMTINHQILR
jgi:hypothetical protein